MDAHEIAVAMGESGAFDPSVTEPPVGQDFRNGRVGDRVPVDGHVTWPSGVRRYVRGAVVLDTPGTWLIDGEKHEVS